jgi:hypothetical protein
MTNIRRGAYEPRIDKLPVLEAADERDNSEDGSRLPLLIVIALVVLAAFAGVVWLAYTQGVARGRADAPRIIAANKAFETSGASRPDFTGLQIYQPIARAKPGAASVSHHAQRPASQVPALRPAANSASDAAEESVDLSPLTTPKAQGGASAGAPAMAPNAANPVSPTPAKIPPAPSQDPVAGQPGIVLQIGSYRSQAEADESGRTFKARHAIVAGYQMDVKEVNLGSRGTWYRLRVGSFADRQSAIGVCEKLKADGANCLIAH